MKKILAGLVFFMISVTANAVPVMLVSQQATGGGTTVTTLITDGSHVSGIVPPSTVVWDWDGSTLTGTGLYAATASLNSSPLAPTILSDQVMDLVIATGGTPGGVASATSYTCVEGTFLSGVGRNGCGGYSLGANFIDESATSWSGISVSQTLGGDDYMTGGPRTIADFNYGLDSIIGVDGLTPGDLIVLGNGIPLDQFFADRMTFQVIPVPAAAWLFGSALALLGWWRRKAK